MADPTLDDVRCLLAEAAGESWDPEVVRCLDYLFRILMPRAHEPAPRPSAEEVAELHMRPYLNPVLTSRCATAILAERDAAGLAQLRLVAWGLRMKEALERASVVLAAAHQQRIAAAASAGDSEGANASDWDVAFCRAALAATLPSVAEVSEALAKLEQIVEQGEPLLVKAGLAALKALRGGAK